MNQDSHESDRKVGDEGMQAEAPEGADAVAAPDVPGPGRRNRRPAPTPVQRALGLLVRREHSRKELARKLAARGVEAGEAAAAVERLAGEGWQDDTRFAAALVRGRAGAGYGPIYIRAELGTHGLGAEAIAAALDGYEGDWIDTARDLVRRRFGPAGPLDLAQRRKAADLLARRGFEGDSIRAATRFDPDD
jgi:regulatory protein